jgi:ArsR family transcriptional regulator, arsenate/arsenite/antimonite-responsive transcriptional repressor
MAMDERSALSALGALAQGTRLKAFRLLVEAGPAGLPAGAIADALGVPAPTLSFHLAQLTHAGLILQRRNSRLLIYSANFPEMNGLVAYLTENCCGGAVNCVPVCEPLSLAAPKGVPRHEAASRPRRRDKAV